MESAPLEPTVDAKMLAKVCLYDVWSSHIAEYFINRLTLPIRLVVS